MVVLSLSYLLAGDSGRGHVEGLAFNAALVLAIAEPLVVADVDAGGDLVLLGHAVYRRLGVVGASTYGDGCHLAVGAGLRLGDDVEYATHALGIVLGARVENHLDAFDARGGQRLEDGGSVLSEHRILLAVEVDLKVGLAVDVDVVLGVDGDHGHLA